MKQFLNKVFSWFEIMKQDDMERYLNNSQDIYEVERRIRYLESN